MTATDVPKTIIRRKRTATPVYKTSGKTRASLTAGTVVILLAGQQRGRKAVVLATLPSGDLVVAGPMKLSGVPLKRISQAYVIATSVKVDMSGVDVSGLTDAVFCKRNFQGESHKTSPVLAPLQKRIDAALLPKIKAVKQLAGYMKTSFSLQKGQAPHAMKF